MCFQTKTGQIAHCPLVLANRALLVGQSLGPPIFVGRRAIMSIFPEVQSAQIGIQVGD